MALIELAKFLSSGVAKLSLSGIGDKDDFVITGYGCGETAWFNIATSETQYLRRRTARAQSE
jgi:hypothetical protein